MNRRTLNPVEHETEFRGVLTEAYKVLKINNYLKVKIHQQKMALVKTYFTGKKST